MGLIVYSEPTDYALAYNDNAYVVRSTNYTPTFRFKVGVAIAATNEIIASITVYPTINVTGFDQRAHFDIKRILQSQVGHDISLPTSTHDGFLVNSNSHFDYSLFLIGEDKNVDGIYETVDLRKIVNKSVWNGVKDITDWLDFDPDDYVLTTGASATKFLTDGPNTREVNSGDSASLYLVGSEDNAPNGYYITTYDGYNATGNQLNNVLVRNTHRAVMTADKSKRYLRVPVGPQDIPFIDPSVYSGTNPATLLNGVKSYGIRLWDNTFPISERFTFNIDQECTKFTPIRLQWLNRMGGMDPFNFNLKSTDRTKVNRENFRQEHHTFRDTTWGYDKMARGRTEYDVQTTKTIEVNTNYLSDAESVWMEDMFTSPVLYQEVGGELLSVNINGRSIEKKKSLNNKLNQYTFEIEYSHINTRQRG